jgi:hypothetical protein
MNRADRLESILKERGGRATLGQLIWAVRNDGGLAYKLTAAVSELRERLELSQPPLSLRWTRGPTPSEGIYEIIKAENGDHMSEGISICPKCKLPIFTTTHSFLPNPFLPASYTNLPNLDCYANGEHLACDGSIAKKVIQKMIGEMRRDHVDPKEISRYKKAWNIP